MSIDITPEQRNQEEAQDLRLKLLRKVMREGPQPVSDRFALDKMFPDTTIETWCSMTGLKYIHDTENYEDGTPGPGFYQFYVDEEIDTPQIEELSGTEDDDSL